MGRPKTPIISRELVIVTALAVIDEEGLSALTLRRLAERLGVNIGSLYYHYRYKDDILRDVIKYVLAPLNPSKEPVADWRQFFMRRSRTYFRLLREHPNLAALGFSVMPRTFGFAVESQAAEVLLDAGVPARYVVVIREQIELTVRGVLQFSFDSPLFDEVPDEFASFGKLVEQAGAVSPEERLDLAIGMILDGIEQRLPQWKAEAVTGRQIRRSRPARTARS